MAVSEAVSAVGGEGQVVRGDTSLDELQCLIRMLPLPPLDVTSGQMLCYCLPRLAVSDWKL